MGGAMTYTRALQIRRLAKEVSLDHLVLETDAPDIAPEWLTGTRRNEPAEVKRIAETMAEIREISLDELVKQTGDAALRVCPRWRC